MPNLVSLATELSEITRGHNWSDVEANRVLKAILPASRTATTDELDAALRVFVDRLANSRIDDCDGVAHIAMTGGTLVEAGASPTPLGDVLIEKLPNVLEAARRCADSCPRNSDEEPADDVLFQVDGAGVPRHVFYALLKEDRPGACALINLETWTLPSVAAWTRDRACLERATRDQRLVAAATTLRDSNAHFLDKLLGVELDASWLVVLPVLGRAFDVHVDGVVSNWDLHVLLAHSLSAHGVAVNENPRELIATLCSEEPTPRGASARGTWNMYSPRACVHDLAQGASVPTNLWVWGEGQPRDVPRFQDRRTLLLGPASFERSWSAGRTFCKLFATVRVDKELPESDVRELLRAMRAWAASV